jgi:hypothetical protein
MQPHSKQRAPARKKRQRHFDPMLLISATNDNFDAFKYP